MPELKRVLQSVPQVLQVDNSLTELGLYLFGLPGLVYLTNLEFKFKDVFPDNEFPCFLLSLGSWLEPELAVGFPSPPIH